MLIKQFWIVFVEVIVPHEDVCHLPELNMCCLEGCGDMLVIAFDFTVCLLTNK